MKSIKKTIRKLHLILGISSGLVILIVALTGCFYAFKVEIEELTQNFRHVRPENRDFILPSEAEQIGKSVFPDREIHGVLYGKKDDAAEIIFFELDPEFYQGIFINPYSGEILKVKDYNRDFFRFILDGHFYLWLPPDIGQPVVASFTLIFVLLMISGLFLWWPRRSNVKQRFRIKWNASWRRKNFDLHGVLGFYVMSVGFILAFTGLIWGFQWFAKTVYHTAGGDKELVYSEPFSVSGSSSQEKVLSNVDRLWKRMRNEYQDVASIEMHFPPTDSSSIYVNIKKDEQTYWRSDYRYFDRITLEEIEPSHIWDDFENASVADKLMRMNYDIHVGAILGLPGKILMFFTSLLVASLPITGFLLWLGRNKKTKSKTKAKSYRKEPEMVEV